MRESFEKLTSNLLKARFPFLYVNSWEEERIINTVKVIAKDKELIKTVRNVFTWTLTDGLILEESNSDSSGKSPTSEEKDPRKFLDFVENYEEPAIFIAKDFHVLFGGDRRGTADHMSIRKLRDLAPKLKTSSKPKNLIFVSPTLVLPIELQKDTTIVEFDLPTVDDIKKVLLNLTKANSQNPNIQINLNDEEIDQLARAAQGLTINEAENAFARALVKDGIMDINDLEVITEEKQQIIKKNGVLELVNNNLNLSEVGGLSNLKKWLSKREKAWLNPSKEYNLPYPKGVLITGVPGCGKSLIAKAISASWKASLLKFDIGRTFSSLVGSSEENMREAIKTAEAVSPCILWIDEIEKGFSGLNNSGDSGTSSRVFGNFLTWLQEKEGPVFVVATANNINQLPPELMRKGRFDEIFFVDLPTLNERKEIFTLHIKKRIKSEIQSEDFVINDETITKLSELTEGFTGAEVEQVVIESLFEAYSESRKVKMDDFVKAIKFTVPLSVTQSETIKSLREWANLRAVNATPKDELSEYVMDSEIKKDDDKDNKGTPNISNARGGRTLDF
ncbi:MAG: AAA family ATPase [Sebaldella sp.]|nr:AAA family ATPase [Sebaldella sp.]